MKIRARSMTHLKLILRIFLSSSMNRKKITQKEAIFYKLYQAFKDQPGVYIPVFEFMGEIYAKEVSKWGFVSHECSARASEMRRDNPGLIEAKKVTGVSGAKYYTYRINPEAKPEMIKDELLARFYKILKLRNA
jgi:hypothetical protein